MDETDIGINLLKWLQSKRESIPGKGRSAREQLLDVVFHNNTDDETVKDIAKEVARLYQQELEDSGQIIHK